jgi:hypothetical protein
MIKNYLKIAWRHLKKNVGYSTINIAGLAFLVEFWGGMCRGITDYVNNRKLSRDQGCYF